jgi:hypothetical protein
MKTGWISFVARGKSSTARRHGQRSFYKTLNELSTHLKKGRGDTDTSLVMTDRFSPDDLGKTGQSVDFNLENDSFEGIVLTFD